MMRFDPQAMKRMGDRGRDMSAIYPAKFGYDLDRPLDQQDPKVLQAMKLCSPINFVSSDDPPVLVFHQAPQPITSSDHPPVPATINDPHSYWYGVLLSDALEKVGVPVQRHMGPNTRKDRDTAEQVAKFIIKHLQAK